MRYMVHASLVDDLNQGWIWANNIDLSPRSTVKIINLKNNIKVYCECLEIDNNYLRKYNVDPRISIDNNIPSITINSWYRSKLGNLDTKTIYELEIWEANESYYKLFASNSHPQVIVRLATKLAVLSVFLGILGLFI